MGYAVIPPFAGMTALFSYNKPAWFPKTAVGKKEAGACGGFRCSPDGQLLARVFDGFLGMLPSFLVLVDRLIALALFDLF